MEQREVLSALVVTNTDDSGLNSLRWAIEQANSTTSAAGAVIDFDISATDSPLIIHLASPLPPIAVPVTLDGTTQEGYQGTPIVEIDGSGLSGTANDGLTIQAGGSLIRGLSLVGFSGSAIVLESGGGNVVTGNELGLTVASGLASPNQQGITLLGSSNNTIGFGTDGPGNVISGNTGSGILIEPGFGVDSTANQVVGNLIGTSPDGLHAIGNGGAGIDVLGSGGNLIGMPGQGFGNIVSGNDGPGIILTNNATGNIVQNNDIGVAADAETELGNQEDGVEVFGAPATLIGGPDPADQNIIAANQGNGIATSGDTAGLLVEGNAIGTDPTGTMNLGNIQNGVCLGSSLNTIGGTGSGAANIIAFNGAGRVGAGVQLLGLVDDNSILSNSIDENAGLGINFGSGPTPNHAPGTAGPNNDQNYPVLSLAQDDGAATTVSGTLFENPHTTYLIQFFSSPQPDPTGYGQGKTFLGSMDVETNAQGSATFTAGLPTSAAGVGEYVSATATDPSGDTSEFAADIPIQPQINLVLSGSAAPDPVVDGDDLTYTLAVTNEGTADAHNVYVADQLPSSVSLVSALPSQGYLVPMMGGGTIEAALGTVAAGGSATLTIVVQTGTGSVGTITDLASVSSQETDPTPGLESVSIPATVETAADVSIMLDGPANPVLAGGDFDYTMTVSNLGPQEASNVVATLPLAPGLAFVSDGTTSGTVMYAAGQAVANLGSLPEGSQVIVTVIVQATVAGSLTESATVSSSSLDPDLSNDASTVTTQIGPAADLQVQITADTAVAADGIPFNYTVTVTNNGPSDASSVALTDTLPAGLTLVSVGTDPEVSPTVVDGVLSAAFASLPAGSSTSITIAVTPTAPPGATLIDTANVEGAQADPDPSNDSASLSLPVRGASDLAVTATSQPGPFYAGQPLTYTIDVTNNGPDDEPDAVLSGAVPADAVVDSTSSTQGSEPSVSQGIMTEDLGPLPAGQTAVVTLVVTPGATDVGTFTAGFSVQGLNDDPDLTNNSAVVSVNVGASSDLAVQIVPGNVAAVADINWSYIVHVTNNGPSADPDVVATIPVPSGATFVSASTSQGSVPPEEDDVVTADLGTIAAGGSASITIVIDPGAPLPDGATTLAAQVSGASYDPVPTNNETSLQLAVAPSVNMTLSLDSTPQVVPSGQVVSFTASVRNAGQTPATGVIVSFPQINGLTYIGATPSQGTPALVSGQFFARLGELAPGASATVKVEELATTPGSYTMTASVAENEYNVDLPSASATTTAQVVESPGLIEFGAAGYEVTDQSGVAVIPVVRLYGASGTVTVQYQAIGVNAIPGRDFSPVAGTLTLGPGQWAGSIQVPVLDDPYLSHDTYVNVTLESPTGGADLGPTTSTLLHIQDVDPDFVPPMVSNLSWAGSSRAIESVTLQFTAPLDPAFATNLADYHLVREVGGQSDPIASITYDATNFSVTIVPQTAIPSGQYTEIQVVGTGTDAIRDLAGNLLDGDGNGAPGSDYTASFAQGSRLRYVDNARNTVTLRVTGPGYLQQVLDSDGEGVLLNLVGMVPHRTTIKGSIKAGKRGSGQTEIGTITGLGQFGSVKVLLKTPPFRVTQYPFQRRGKFVL